MGLHRNLFGVAQLGDLMLYCRLALFERIEPGLDQTLLLLERFANRLQLTLLGSEVVDLFDAGLRRRIE